MHLILLITYSVYCMGLLFISITTNPSDEKVVNVVELHTASVLHLFAWILSGACERPLTTCRTQLDTGAHLPVCLADIYVFVSAVSRRKFCTEWTMAYEGRRQKETTPEQSHSDV